MSKVWLAVITVFAVLAVSLAYFVLPNYMGSGEGIVVVGEKTFSSEELKLLSGTTYTVEYTHDGISENYTIQKAVHEDVDSLNFVVTSWFAALGDNVYNKTDVEYGEFQGYSLGTLDPDTGEIVDYSILVTRAAVLASGSGPDKSNLDKVFAWFMERY
jgi:hypothetical protein